MQDFTDDARQQRDWEKLHSQLEGLLRRFGKDGYLAHADYFLVDDNWGCRQHKVYVSNLKMLSPQIVKLMQNSLRGFPDWEIILAVDLEGAAKLWPKMGLIIRQHEIIDGLQRKYFPKEFHGLKYEGSRRGPVLNEV